MLPTRLVLVPQVLFHLISYLHTLSRSDVLLASTESIVLLELSVVNNTQHQLLAIRNRKEDHYGLLLLDLQHAGLS